VTGESKSTTEERDPMPSFRVLATVSAVATGLLLSGCSAGQGAPAGPGRPADEPILGVRSSDGPPECVEPAVRRTADTNVLELTVSGLPGDVVDYRVTRRDGTVVSGTTGEFGPGQREAVLSTGVPNAEIDTVTLTATGAVGVPGSCVITTIR
jgi:hypothetical protein